jgi:flavin reductase (DIM6/NTAB) family NADH-FMN oxidoreductase RutF
LLAPCPDAIIASYDSEGKANAMAAAWCGVAASGPEQIAVGIRPSRYSIGGIKQRGCFTLNLPSAKFVKEADLFGMASGRKINKFAATGLTPLRSEVVDAPYIKEFPYSMSCSVTHTVDLGAHILFVAEVKEVLADSSCLDAEGKLNWRKADIIGYDTSTKEYFRFGEVVGQGWQAGKAFLKA